MVCGHVCAPFWLRWGWAWAGLGGWILILWQVVVNTLVTSSVVHSLLMPPSCVLCSVFRVLCSVFRWEWVTWPISTVESESRDPTSTFNYVDVDVDVDVENESRDPSQLRWESPRKPALIAADMLCAMPHVWLYKIIEVVRHRVASYI